MEYLQCFERSELKYMLTQEQFDWFMSAASRELVPDEYPEGSIRSLYFDTPESLLILRSCEQPEYKEKLRLRAYSQVESGETVFAELKKKYASIVYKRRTGLSEAEAMRWLAGETHRTSTQIEREIDAFTSGGDGALDYGERATAKISGGTVFAFGSASMAENFNTAENQGAALVSLSGNAGDTVTLSSSDGEKLASASPTKKYECVVVSCNGMSENGSYTLTNGTTDKTFTLSGLLYGESGTGMGGGTGGFGGKDNGRQPFGEIPTNENGEVEMPGGRQGMPDGERREPPTDGNGNMQKPSGGNAADGNGQIASNGSSQTASA